MNVFFPLSLGSDRSRTQKPSRDDWAFVGFGYLPQKLVSEDNISAVQPIHSQLQA
ncbi:hypothetical protein [Nostoc parmelioides]|uniref:Uncharacterized protein n=1 Tax=Nostoc parmelioides FACHB-3921 TaxID=2692909 RepID=A0ABR8BQU5_9NOSO|nr:hypothetical protein [Nostoc parmelioides]MBD2255293.1 hypothetical protein [Nostoc parmelioides FACHB-3921]